MQSKIQPPRVQDKAPYQPAAGLFKLLAHPARIAILSALRSGEACVCHLEAALGYRQAYLSQQLALLRAAGVVEDRREGWNIYYRASRPAVFDLLDEAARLSGRPLPVIEKPAHCPCPKCNQEENV